MSMCRVNCKYFYSYTHNETHKHNIPDIQLFRHQYSCGQPHYYQSAQPVIQLPSHTHSKMQIDPTENIVRIHNQSLVYLPRSRHCVLMFRCIPNHRGCIGLRVGELLLWTLNACYDLQQQLPCGRMLEGGSY